MRKITIFVVLLAVIASCSVAYAQNGYGTSTSSTTVPVVITPISSTISSAQTPSFSTFNFSTADINSSQGGNVTAMGPDGSYMAVFIYPGTDAQIGNKRLSEYNFTLVTFNITNNSVSSPPGEPNSIPIYSFAFEINGNITSSISLVNGTTGQPEPVVTFAEYNQSWGSWTFLGGKLNGSNYTGGAYTSEDNWSYNSTYNFIMNTQFYKPVMSVFIYTPGISNTTTVSTAVVQHTSSTTISINNSTAPVISATTGSTKISKTTQPSSSRYIYAIAAMIVIIIVLVAYIIMLRVKNKGSNNTKSPKRQ